jgi:acyl-CoA thioesterase-1
MRNSRQKINIILLTTYYLLLTTLAGCAKREIKNIDSKGASIICFGDSITFGYGVASAEDYPTALAKLVTIPVINMGIDGDTSIEALKRLESDVLERDPLLVIIEFGGNDFLRKIPQDVTLKNVKEMVEKIQARGAMAAVVDISAGMFLAEYRRAFDKLAKEKGALYIPSIFSGIITNPRLKSDFIHPNAEGYKLIAQRIYQTIKPYLNQNTRLRQAQK